MESDTDKGRDGNADGHPDLRGSVEDRARRVFSRMEKPRTPDSGRPFAGITNDEKRVRMQLVEECVRLGMPVEQMVDFLPTLGLTLSRSQVYEYLGRMKLPRWYRPSEAAQSHHDYYTFRFFIRAAQDAARSGYRTHHLSKGTAPCDGARFRPDFSFAVGRYQFFMEMQLSDLTETRWSVKFRNYLRLRQLLGRPFRALFVIDQRGDLAYCRASARKVLGEGYSPFLFVPLDELKGSRNVATDPVWLTPWGEKVPLLLYLPPPGQKPPEPRQR